MSIEEHSFSYQRDGRITTYPIPFDPLIKKYRLGFDNRFGHNNKNIISPLEEAIKEYNESEEELANDQIDANDKKEPVNSRLIDDLNKLCTKALTDYNQAFETPYAYDDVLLRNYLEEKQDDFFENGIKRYAFEFEKIFDGLINYDNFPKKIFRNYKQIKKVIDYTEGRTAAKYLRQLIIIGEQLIPVSIKQGYTEIIESNNSYADSVEEN